MNYLKLSRCFGTTVFFLKQTKIPARVPTYVITFFHFRNILLVRLVQTLALVELFLQYIHVLTGAVRAEGEFPNARI